MTDLIDRQAAIDVLDTGLWGVEWDKALATAMLKDLPPAECKAHWIYGEDKYGIDGYYCDKCNFFVPWDYVHKFINYIEDYHYCPNCGARMEIEE